MILSFNFALVRRTRDLNQAARGLEANILCAIKGFYCTYHRLLGKTLEELVSGYINYENPIASLQNLVGLINYHLSTIKNSGDYQHPLISIQGVSVDFSYTLLL